MGDTVWPAAVPEAKELRRKALVLKEVVAKGPLLSHHDRHRKVGSNDTIRRLRWHGI
jgi:hypothetical protein